MKKMNYKKPLVEVMDFEVADILKTSGENVDGSVTGSMANFSMKCSEDAASIILDN